MNFILVNITAGKQSITPSQGNNNGFFLSKHVDEFSDRSSKNFKKSSSFLRTEGERSMI